MHTATAVPSPGKNALRVETLAARRVFARGLSLASRADMECQIMERVLPHLGNATTIAAYCAMNDEIDPAPIVVSLLAAGRIVVFPWFAARSSNMMFRQGPADVHGPWGIPQPGVDAVAIAPEIVLVPLVAADLERNRIGHGKGHYDRALAHLRASGPVRTIGLAWDMQIRDVAIEPDVWDVPLDAIATPDRWLTR